MNAENAEKNLWDQVRSLSQISVRLAQWGLATLLGFWTALYFVRKDMLGALSSPLVTPSPSPTASSALDAFLLQARHPLPIVRFVIGNVLLWLVDFMFYKMSNWIRTRLFFYIKCFEELPTIYPDENVRVYPKMPPNNRTMGINIVALFFFVPFADCVLYGLNWCFWWLKL